MRHGLLLALLLTLVCGASAQHPDDAALHAVHFFDAKEGWTVGDEGVIWHTIDGGKSWERQSSGTRASLRSVFFHDELLGWAVGREELPFGASRGVVLFTRDGGLRWQKLLENALPGLNQVRFTDHKNGLLLGDGIDPFSSGMFRTSDGGKSWAPVRGGRTTSWAAGDFQDGKNGILVGPWGRLVTLRNDEWAAAERGLIGSRGLRAVQILSKRLLAAGEGGLVLTSASAGSSWGFADLNLPPAARACLDFNGIAMAGERVWLVGRPGSVVLVSDDGGATWKTCPTGQPLPLHGVHFVDKNRGWAVGAAGTILATRDGGATWETQRRGIVRGAVLCVHSRAADVPFDTLAHLGKAEGYHAIALAVGRDDPMLAAPVHACMPPRLHQAVRNAGGVAAEQLGAFPMPSYLLPSSKDQLLRHWNQLHAGQAPQELVRHLVLALRIWRPEVVTTDAPDGPAAGSLLAEALGEAIRQAGDPKAFPEQIETLGLSPWKARALYGFADRGEGSVAQDNTLPLDALDESPREAGMMPASLVHEGMFTLPPQRSYRFLAAGRPGVGGTANLMDGAVAPFKEARRPSAETPTAKTSSRAAQASRQLVSLVDILPRSELVLTQIVPLLAALPEDRAAQAAFSVACTYVRLGEWDLARETFVLMVDRYPAHPLAAEAYRWLVAHNASGEVRRRHDLGQFARVQPADAISPPEKKKSEIVPASALDLASQLTLLGPLAETRQWHKGALEIHKRLAGFGALASNDPRVQFSVQSAKRSLGDGDGPREWYEKFAGFVARGPWTEAALAERWIDGLAPKPARLANCVFIDRRPHLDGKLDDACWQNQPAMILGEVAGGAAGKYPTQAWLACDREFLYLAVNCAHPRGEALPLAKNRTKDSNVDSHDHVQLLIDVDRDYSTYFRLRVDQRGCVHDDCWGDAAWSPKWYVAAQSNETSWQVEAAIPLGELTTQPITIETRWACNLVRVIPGRGLQSLSLPADVRPRPEGMSVLMFHQDARKTVAPMPKSN